MNIFHKGHVIARDKYKTKANADYWLETLDTTKLNDAMKAFIENTTYFFFATASPDGQPNLNYKGGDKGFLHVVDEHRLVFPQFKGNGILHSMGDLGLNDKVSLLIPDFNHNVRLKIIGKATVIYEDLYMSPYMDYFSKYDYESLIEIQITYVIPNCPNNLGRVKESIMDFNEKDRDSKILHRLMGN